MVRIPNHVKEMILDQQMIVVLPADENGISNISPRTTFTITDDIIYWIELFKQAETFSRRYWNANDLKNGASGEVI